jgi:uroporphyrin-III C-methyltransferase / precorrin-2 dehydrogenase / sirohydrochlorin ferrochelatase
MNQLPVFVTIDGKPIILVGEGEAADAKRRLIERAGGLCVGEDDGAARLAFVALEGEAADEAAARLKARGLLTNVVDRPELCDFTVPAIVDRDPLLVAVGTGGASAGLAKMVRQAIERLLPESLGALAIALKNARAAMRAKWPDGAARRQQLDQALVPGGMLDPLSAESAAKVGEWLASDGDTVASRLIHIALCSNDPEDLKLGTARLLGQADHIYLDGPISEALSNRARADAIRHAGPPPAEAPSGLVIHLTLRNCALHD